MQRVCKVYQETDLQNKKMGLTHSLLQLQTHLCHHYDLGKRKVTVITKTKTKRNLQIKKQIHILDVFVADMQILN